MVFEVFQSYKSENSFVTCPDINGTSFEFLEVEKGQFILKQRNEKKGELLYVPSELFEGELPDNFIHRYSHWYHEKQHKIFFRPKKYADKKFEDSISYVLDLNNYQLSDFSMKDVLLIDINSVTFDEIYTKAIRRLELKEHIHIFTDKSGGITVNLPRMGLNFEVETDRLNSKEYEGKYVAFDQTIETLRKSH